jgi:hypothetical protein
VSIISHWASGLPSQTHPLQPMEGNNCTPQLESICTYNVYRIFLLLLSTCAYISTGRKIALNNEVRLLPYSGKFLHGAKLCIFADRLGAAKIRTAKL